MKNSTVERDVQQTQIALGYRTFGCRDPRRYALTVMDGILGRGMSSRLFIEVREKRGLSYDIQSHGQMFSDAGMWTVTAGVSPDKAETALKVIDAEIRKISTKKVGAAELKRVKEFLTGNFRLSHERVTSKLFFYGAIMLSYGRLETPAQQVEGVRKVTAEDVLAVAKAIFKPANRSLSLVVPKNFKGGRK